MGTTINTPEEIEELIDNCQGLTWSQGALFLVKKLPEIKPELHSTLILYLISRMQNK